MKMRSGNRVTSPERESFGMAFLSLLLTLGVAVGTFVLMIFAVALFGG